MVRGFAALRKTAPNARLTLVGGGPQKLRLEELAKELLLADRIRFVGSVPHADIQQYYQDADIFVSMSRSESFSTACLEAMACGLAIVAAKTGGYEDAIADGITGYLVDQEDVEAFADRLRVLIENRALRQQFSRAARRGAEEEYDWERAVVPKYVALYKSLL